MNRRFERGDMVRAKVSTTGQLSFPDDPGEARVRKGDRFRVVATPSFGAKMITVEPLVRAGYQQIKIQSKDLVIDPHQEECGMRALLAMMESTDLYCPNCKENLGKKSENPKAAWCGVCGTAFSNPGGSDDGSGSLEDRGHEILGALRKVVKDSNVKVLADKADLKFHKMSSVGDLRIFYSLIGNGKLDKKLVDQMASAISDVLKVALRASKVVVEPELFSRLKRVGFEIVDVKWKVKS